MLCPQCQQPVEIGGENATHYYVPKHPAHCDEPACPLCGSLDVDAVKAQEEEDVEAVISVE